MKNYGIYKHLDCCVHNFWNRQGNTYRASEWINTDQQDPIFVRKWVSSLACLNIHFLVQRLYPHRISPFLQDPQYHQSLQPNKTVLFALVNLQRCMYSISNMRLFQHCSQHLCLAGTRVKHLLSIAPLLTVAWLYTVIYWHVCILHKIMDLYHLSE